MSAAVLHGDSLDKLGMIKAESISALITDPPYGLGFMGKDWDKALPDPAIWSACLRVMKPGAHGLVFGGTRLWHRLAVHLEDSGFEIRDTLMWVYGSGFPKSLDVGKAIDKAAGAEREVVGIAGRSGAKRACMAGDFTGGEYMESAPATDAAKQWDGWGTALKPAWEPILLIRKPLSGTVAANVQEHGTGGINVDGCRVGEGTGKPRPEYTPNQRNAVYGTGMGGGAWENTSGRWPTNFIPQEMAADLLGDKARFFYCPKASKKDRGDGNNHPTVKPQELMRWLCRLITPPGGTVLDPFAGSGSTLVAAKAEGFPSIGIEREAEYCGIIKGRLADAAE